MKTHIAALLAASLLANSALLAAVAEEYGGADDADTETEETKAAGSSGRGGRPRGSKKTEPEPPKGKDLDALLGLIEPLVEAGKGEQVKKVITRHAPGGGGLAELATLPQNQAAFEKDLKGLEF